MSFWVRAIEAAMKQARSSPYLLSKGLAWAFAFHVLGVMNACVAGLAVGWETPSMLGFFVVIPLVLIAGALPLTPSGIGIQEGAFVFLLQRIGATKAEAFGVAILLRAKAVLIAAVGAAFWLYLRRTRRIRLQSEEEKALVERGGEAEKALL